MRSKVFPLLVFKLWERVLVYGFGTEFHIFVILTDADVVSRCISRKNKVLRLYAFEGIQAYLDIFLFFIVFMKLLHDTEKEVFLLISSFAVGSFNRNGITFSWICTAVEQKEV